MYFCDTPVEENANDIWQVRTNNFAKSVKVL